MQEFRKRWLSLGVALASGISMGAVAADNHSAVADPALGGPQVVVAGEGGEGEGGGVTPVSLKTDDVAYLSRLGLIRGHLLVGYQLYSQGHAPMAKMHMKHPQDELYAGLLPAIAHRGGTAFDAQLDNLANSVGSEAAQTDVDKAYQALEVAITAAESVTTPSLQTALLSIKDLVRTAGEEYGLGVEDGKLVNAHEYQDAYGFTEIAKRRLAELPADVRAQSPEAIEQVEAVLASLSDLWPSLSPGDSIEGDASRLHGASARIEIVALGL